MEEVKLQLITKAIDECIEKEILGDILIKQRNEVLNVVLETFNQQLYEKNLKQDAYEEGKTEGARIKLKDQVCRKLAKGKEPEEIAEALEENITLIEELIKEITNE